MSKKKSVAIESKMIDVDVAMKELEELKIVARAEKGSRSKLNDFLLTHAEKILEWAKIEKKGSKRYVCYKIKSEFGIEVDMDVLYRFVRRINHDNWPNSRKKKKAEI